MKVVILNGSPKGQTSVTMQYINWLEKTETDHKFIRIDAASRIRKFEEDEKFFQEQMDVISEADIIIWAFPLYFLLVNSGYKRFIELIFERKAQSFFMNKYCGILSTSIHYFDNTAVNYIQDICIDLGMNYVDTFTPKMDDLMNTEYRQSLNTFFKRIISYKKNEVPVLRISDPITESKFNYTPTENKLQINTEKNITIVTDGISDNTINIASSISQSINNSKTVNLKSLKMTHCLGCLKCGYDNICAFEGKDDYIEMHRNNIINADVIIFVLKTVDRYFSYLWQRFLERSFYRTHQPTISGKQILFIIDGKIFHNRNAMEILRGWSETMGANLHPIISTEINDNISFNKTINTAVQSAVSDAEKNIMKPKSFAGVGGMNIFRDDIYDGLKMLFNADHRYYKKHGIYNFPTRKIFKRIFTGLGFRIIRIPFVKRKVRNNMKEFMLTPYKQMMKSKFKTK